MQHETPEADSYDLSGFCLLTFVGFDTSQKKKKKKKATIDVKLIQKILDCEGLN